MEDYGEKLYLLKSPWLSVFKSPVAVCCMVGQCNSVFPCPHLQCVYVPIYMV